MTHEAFFREGRYIGQEVMGASDVISTLDPLLVIEDPQQRQTAFFEFTQQRLKELHTGSSPQAYEMFVGSLEGFIHPDSTIGNYTSPFNMNMFSPIQLDDESVYPLFLESLSFFKRERFQGYPTEALITLALSHTIARYFFPLDPGEQPVSFDDVHDANTSLRLKDQTQSIPNFKNAALCAQQAPLAHNLLTFLGKQATLIYSLDCEAEEQTFPHVYNLIQEDDHSIIYDPTNYGDVYDQNGEYQSWFPAMYVISEKDRQHLFSSGSVTVAHSDLRTSPYGYELLEPKRRVYSGIPKQN